MGDEDNYRPALDCGGGGGKTPIPSVAEILRGRGFEYEAEQMDEMIDAFDEMKEEGLLKNLGHAKRNIKKQGTPHPVLFLLAPLRHLVNAAPLIAGHPPTASQNGPWTLAVDSRLFLR